VGQAARKDRSGQASGGSRQNFPRASRLLRRSEFEAVYGAGRRRSSPQFTLFFGSQRALTASRTKGAFAATLAQPEFEASAATATRRVEASSGSRFGISVKKAVGGAVVRNRIRRRIREILRRNQTEIPAGWDIVIHPRGSVAEALFAPLEAELLSLLKSLGTSDAPPAN
jgi:ribonuclease P protein component